MKQQQDQEKDYVARLTYHFKEYPQERQYFQAQRLGNIMSRLRLTKPAELITFNSKQELMEFLQKDTATCSHNSNAKTQSSPQTEWESLVTSESLNSIQDFSRKPTTPTIDKTTSDRSMSTLSFGLREKVYIKGILIGFFCTITALYLLNKVT